MADNNDDGPQPSPVGGLRAAWVTAKPKRRDYGTVVAELNSLKSVGEGRGFERGLHVPVTYLGYFKPPRTHFSPICSPRTDDSQKSGNRYMRLVYGWN